MKVKKVWLLLLFMSVMLFSGCQNAKWPYHAVMYGNVYENRTWLKDDFYESNLTYGSFSTAAEDYIQDENFPSSRTKILKTADECETVFREIPADVDFEKSMIVMYCFTTPSGSSYEIENISLNEKTLSVQYSAIQSKRPARNASMPLSKWIIVILDKSDIETAEFVYIK